MYKNLIYRGFCIVFLAGCTPKAYLPVYWRAVPSREAIEQEPDKARKLYYSLLGHFSNKPYLAEHPEVRDIEQEIVAVPIFPQHLGENWLYYELFPASLPEKPVLHRVFQIARRSPDTLILRSFRLKEPEKHVNEWRKEKPFEGLKKSDIAPLDSCDKYLVADSLRRSIFVTTNRDEWCVNLFTNGGPVRFVKSWYEFSPESVAVWADLFGAEREILRKTFTRYYRLSPKDPNYRDLTKEAGK